MPTAADPPQPGTAGVAFHAGHSEVVELTWSQQYYLDELVAARPHGRSLGIPRWYELRAGTGLPDVLAALRELVERYAALRARPLPGDQRPRQWVAGTGTLPVTVQTLPAPAAPLPDVGRRVLAGLLAEPFAVHTEWPVRAAVVVDPRGARLLALVFSHLAADGYALLPVGRLLVERCAVADLVDRSPPGGDGAAHQLADQVAAERSPAGRRQAERALRHAEEVLWRMPPAGPPPPPGPGGYAFAAYRSGALDLAVGAVCHRTGQTPATVLAAAMAVVEAATAGATVGYLRLLAANRLRPGSTHAVLPCSLPVPCLVPLAGRSFDEVVRQMSTESLRAFRAGGAPPREFAGLAARVGRQRGVSLDPTPTLNYRPRASQLPARPVTAGELAAAAPPRLAWTDSHLQWSVTRYLSADVGAGGVDLLLQVDTGRYRRSAAAGWLAALRRLLVRAALDDVPAAAVVDDVEPSTEQSEVGAW